MISRSRTYKSKVLLFGEYTILCGSHSLAIPYDRFSAAWKFSTEITESNKQLMLFAEFLSNIKCDWIDNLLFMSELEQGLYLDSNIPTGYGLGSSGSVVAAVYDRYEIVKFTSRIELLERFKLLESFFHGSSSGLDPLVSFLDEPILIRDGEISTVNLDENPILENLFLYDSSFTRSTAPYVKWYKSSLEHSEFLDLNGRLTLLANKLIQVFLSEDSQSFDEIFRTVSLLQVKLLSKMFPQSILKELNYLQKNASVKSFKLCGAGGGGFYLFSVYAPDDKLPLLPLSKTKKNEFEL